MRIEYSSGPTNNGTVSAKVVCEAIVGKSVKRPAEIKLLPIGLKLKRQETPLAHTKG